jgi:hypothetical protein
MINKHNGMTTPKQLRAIISLINADRLVFEMGMSCVYHEAEIHSFFQYSV